MIFGPMDIRLATFIHVKNCLTFGSIVAISIKTSFQDQFHQVFSAPTWYWYTCKCISYHQLTLSWLSSFWLRMVQWQSVWCKSINWENSIYNRTCSDTRGSVSKLSHLDCLILLDNSASSWNYDLCLLISIGMRVLSYATVGLTEIPWQTLYH